MQGGEWQVDLHFDESYKRFRAQVRSFLDAHRADFPKPHGGRRPPPETLAWQRLLVEQGFVGRTVPTVYGGYGAQPDLLQSLIIAEEFTRAGITQGLTNQGVGMLVPTLLEAGSEEQKRRWIGPTLRGEILWCQGYSEPDAGSDLASLRTSAIEDRADFVINGQKIWTSGAQFADMMFCLVRTEPDAPKHLGISYLYFDMATPGIEVRPLTTMTGEAEFNEVFFTDVRVPRSQIVGERGQGWRVANATLKHERGMLGDPNAALARLGRLTSLLGSETRDGLPLSDDPLLVDRLMQLQGQALALKYHGERLLTEQVHGDPPGLAAMIVKLRATELNHEIQALGIDSLGEIGSLYEDGAHLRDASHWQERYMIDLGLIIGGGTAQIQKNIIAERGLGMPREPKLDR